MAQQDASQLQRQGKQSFALLLGLERDRIWAASGLHCNIKERCLLHLQQGMSCLTGTTADKYMQWCCVIKAAEQPPCPPIAEDLGQLQMQQLSAQLSGSSGSCTTDSSTVQLRYL